MKTISNLLDSELLAAVADVGESNCSLEHGPGTNASDYPAVNAFVVPIGRRISEIEAEEVRKLTIPICAECAEGLCSDEWTLVYCLDCCANHWISRVHSKLRYRHHILWLQGCHNCGGFGGIYFADDDIPNAPSEDI
jgi:hypothetical protein